MKKLFSILLAGMFLLSGMHLSMATHICGGELAAVHWSFSSEKAACVMESENRSNPSEKSCHSACCQDQITICTVDSNYNLSTIQVNKPINQLLQVFYIPVSNGHKHLFTNFTAITNVQPPGSFLPSAVSLPEICVFRI